MNETPLPVNTEPAVQQPEQQVINPDPQPLNVIPTATPVRRKRKWLLIITALLIVIAGGAAGYYLLLYLPNTPENVFKKAVAKFATEKNYSIAGRLDQGDGNLPDFDYSVKVVGNNMHATVDSSSFMMGPSAELMAVDGKEYIKTSEWMNPTELAKRYTNYGPKGIQESMAEFADTSGVFANQDKWMQIDDYIFDSPATPQANSAQSVEEAGVTVKSIEAIEEIDGEKLRNYKISLSKDGFMRLLDQFSGSSNLRNSFTKYTETEGFPESVDMDVKVDVSDKTIHSLTYSGRPFRDATLSMTLTKTSDTITAPENAPLISDTLDYGIVKTVVFNPITQNANDASDRERIADIKGIKMAMEIYKRKNGKYPNRGYSVNQQGEMYDTMRGADRAIFEDPNGKVFNWHGSQYTYIGETADSSDMCGSAYYNIDTGKDMPTPDCSKFWVVSLLNNGQEFKLVSDN